MSWVLELNNNISLIRGLIIPLRFTTQNNDPTNQLSHFRITSASHISEHNFVTGKYSGNGGGGGKTQIKGRLKLSIDQGGWLKSVR